MKLNWVIVGGLYSCLNAVWCPVLCMKICGLRCVAYCVLVMHQYDILLIFD